MRLYILQQERYFVSKIKALLGKQVNLNELIAIKSEVDNSVFYSQQSSADQELLLQVGTKSFLKSLTKQEQVRAAGLKRMNDDELDIYASEATEANQKDSLKQSPLKAQNEDDGGNSILEVTDFKAAIAFITFQECLFNQCFR